MKMPRFRPAAIHRLTPPRRIPFRRARPDAIFSLRGSRRAFQGPTMHSTRLFALACLAGAGLLAAWPAGAQENFYAGKTIRIIVGTGSGGGYDGAARLTARYLGKYIPGNPAFVVENMPGASGIKATNFLYAAAPRDGTVIATVNNSMPVYQAINQEGVRFKAEDLNWLGSLLQTATTVSIWHTAGVRTIEEARRKEVIMGATGAAGTKAAYPALLNNTLGTKFRIVTGYEGGNTLRLAMERGEVQGDGSARWSSWKSTKPEWVRDSRIFALVQIGLKKDNDLPDVPLLTELAQNDEQRKMFEFISQPIAMQQPFVAPPNVPADRVIMLRRAFEAMTRDPDFRKEVEALDLELDPVSGEDVQRIVRNVVETPAAIVQKVQAATAVSKDAPRAGGGGAGRGGE
jgi:tripartite-type tricarboxylate transporter receptor subunit TctC